MGEALKFNIIGILTILLTVAVFTVDNNTIKLILGITLLIGLVISFIQVQRSLLIPDDQKRLSWIILLPVLSLIFYLFNI